MNKELPAKIMRQIRRYEPVETDGVLLYPVTVDEYDQFSEARPAIEFIHQSLPVAYVSMPLLQAYYVVDIESVVDKQLPTGLLARAMLFIALALRIGVGEPVEERLRRMQIRSKLGNRRRLEAVVCNLDGNCTFEITPMMFQRWLPILAAQNGLTIPEDTENPELLRTEAELLRRKALDLDVKIEDLVSSVADFCRVDESEVYGWPIAKLNNRQSALKLAMDYIISGIGEMQGTTWKHGNPHPHPFFHRNSGGSLALIPLDEFAGGAGTQAVNQALNSNAI